MKAKSNDGLVIRQNVPLSNFSNFRIGGPARYFARIKTPSHLAFSRVFAKKEQLPILIIGRGSNCLFDDQGFEGLAILNDMANIEWRATLIEVETGYSMAKLAVKSARMGLSGLEFGCGIPGSVGGAIFMNAGAHGAETRDCLIGVDSIDCNGEIRRFDKGELELGYRQSIFQKTPFFIWRARFLLQKDGDALARCQKWTQQRLQTQPQKSRSAGCAFRNPEGHSAGSLIERAGLKGMRIGDAQVSTHHANYLINCGQATSREVKALMDRVRVEVLQKFNIHLQTELRIMPPA